MKRVSIDVGGTFTDCLVLDEQGRLREFKSPTTPADPVIGVLDSLNKASSAFSQPLNSFLAQVEILIHGTTLAINTLLTGRGAKTGMITTENFRDVIEMRRGLRDQDVSMFDVFVPPYEPLVPRRWRIGVPERMRYTGEALVPLDEMAVREAVEKLKAEGVSSLAVCFLYSFVNSSHEKRAAEICREVLGADRVTTSHDILPVWREFERFSTTAVSAYVQPVVADYLGRLESRLNEERFGGSLLMMLANGLVQTVEQCRHRAVYLLGSGPAAAPSAALNLPAPLVGKDLISVDMGGTSFDICAIRRGEIPMTTESWVGNHRVAIKMVDVHSIGAGGGSIAWIDSLGLLRVGPQSAGADPGPACYGHGSTEPTVTDADLVLGYVPADYFLGGSISLSEESARHAIDSVAKQLDMTTEQAGQAIFETVNAHMADLITEVCTRRGLDVRDFTMVVGGGAGPVHAAFLADQLGIGTVFVPSVAALYSAFGMLSMDLGRDFARSHVSRVDKVDPDLVAGLYKDMEEQALSEFAPLGIGRDQINFTRTAEMRYIGQFHEVEVPISQENITASTLERAVETLHERHQDLYSFAMPWMPAQFLTFRLLATVARAPFELQRLASSGSGRNGTLKRTRRCLWKGQERETPVYDGDLMEAGAMIFGPAIIEEKTTTVVIPEGFTCLVDPYRNYVLRKGTGSEEIKGTVNGKTGILADGEAR